jgi:hypothetical protein
MHGDQGPDSSAGAEGGVEMVQQYFRALALPTWSVYGLVDRQGGWVSHASEDSSDATGGRAQLSSLTLSYFSPIDQRQLLVRSEVAQPSTSPLALSTFLDWVVRGDLDEEPTSNWITDAPAASASVVDQTFAILTASGPISAHGHRSGDAGGIRCSIDGVWVTVVFRNTEVYEPLQLQPVADLKPLQEQREVIVRDLLSRGVG